MCNKWLLSSTLKYVTVIFYSVSGKNSSWNNPKISSFVLWTSVLLQIWYFPCWNMIIFWSAKCFKAIKVMQWTVDFLAISVVLCTVRLLWAILCKVLVKQSKILKCIQVAFFVKILILTAWTVFACHNIVEICKITCIINKQYFPGFQLSWSNFLLFPWNCPISILSIWTVFFLLLEVYWSLLRQCMTVFLYFKAYSNVSEWSADFCFYLWEEKWQNDDFSVQNQYFLVFFWPICITTSLIVGFSLYFCWQSNYWATGIAYIRAYYVVICPLIVRTFIADNEFQLTGDRLCTRKNYFFNALDEIRPLSTVCALFLVILSKFPLNGQNMNFWEDGIWPKLPLKLLRI